MSSTADNGSTVPAAPRRQAGRATPGAVADTSHRRRHDAQASRQALLEAADALFDERGYDAATVRDIGERAAVDAALIARYFGGKEGLYLATLQQQGRAPMPTDPVRVLERMLSRTEQQGSGPVPRAMVSPTLTDTMREQVRDIVGRRVVQPLAAEIGDRGVPDAELRAEVLVALAIGVSLTRASGTLPTLAAAPLDAVLAVLAPLIDALQDSGAG
jgi:AcrR family transcriptional regulator